MYFYFTHFIVYVTILLLSSLNVVDTKVRRSGRRSIIRYSHRSGYNVRYGYRSGYNYYRGSYYGGSYGGSYNGGSNNGVNYYEGDTTGSADYEYEVSDIPISTTSTHTSTSRYNKEIRYNRPSYSSYYFYFYYYYSPGYYLSSPTDRAGVTVCQNFLANKNNTCLGYFTCPMDFEPDDYTACCGERDAQYCCKPSSANIVAIAVGSSIGGVALIGLIVGIVVAIVLCNKNKSQNKVNSINSVNNKITRNTFHYDNSFPPPPAYEFYNPEPTNPSTAPSPRSINVQPLNVNTLSPPPSYKEYGY